MILNKHRKKFIVIIAMIIMLFLCFINKTPYESDYFGKIGLKEYKHNGHRYLYSEMLNDFGKPINVTKDKYNNIKVEYDDLIFTFWLDSPNADVKSIKILSAKYGFGYKSIGVGASKKAVLSAYSNVSRSPDEGYIWVEGNTFVEFEFEDNIVKSITIWYGV